MHSKVLGCVRRWLVATTLHSCGNSIHALSLARNHSHRMIDTLLAVKPRDRTLRSKAVCENHMRGLKVPWTLAICLTPSLESDE